MFSFKKIYKHKPYDGNIYIFKEKKLDGQIEILDLGKKLKGH
jgi:phage portal protein BeeE